MLGVMQFCEELLRLEDVFHSTIYRVYPSACTRMAFVSHDSFAPETLRSECEEEQQSPSSPRTNPPTSSTTHSHLHRSSTPSTTRRYCKRSLTTTTGDACAFPPVGTDGSSFGWDCCCCCCSRGGGAAEPHDTHAHISRTIYRRASNISCDQTIPLI